MDKRIESARKAFSNRNIEETRKAHEKHLINEKGHSPPGGEHIGDFVYGAIDGVVTTFAVVSGVAGASLSPSIVLILGLGNLFADGFSMAIGNYLSTKSELEYQQQERKREEWEIQNVPEGEIEEIRNIYKKKGFEGQKLEDTIKIITSNKKVWVDTMMMEELNIIPQQKSPFKSALATFIAFVLVGFTPLFTYTLSYFIPSIKSYSFMISIFLTAIALFTVGAIKVFITKKKWWKSGLEVLLVGGLAAIIAYTVGLLLRGLAS